MRIRQNLTGVPDANLNLQGRSNLHDNFRFSKVSKRTETVYWFKKNYIGKGTQVETKSGKVLDIIKITLSVEKMMKFVHEYKEKEYVTFEVATLRNEDQFGHTHTVYSTIAEETETPEEEKTEAEAPKKRRRRTKAQMEADKAKVEAKQADDLPF